MADDVPGYPFAKFKADESAVTDILFPMPPVRHRAQRRRFESLFVSLKDPAR